MILIGLVKYLVYTYYYTCTLLDTFFLYFFFVFLK